MGEVRFLTEEVASGKIVNIDGRRARGHLFGL